MLRRATDGLPCSGHWCTVGVLAGTTHSVAKRHPFLGVAVGVLGHHVFLALAFHVCRGMCQQPVLMCN